MGTVELGILGPFEVRLDGKVMPTGGHRQRALLAVLVLHAGEVVSTDRLIDELWAASPPARAVHTVQVFVSRLRRALGTAGQRLITRPPGYLFDVAPDEIDAERCAHLYASARSALAAGDADRAEALLRHALALWRGPPLAEFTYEPFASAAVARLEELRLSCREELVEAQLALGRHEEIIHDLEALVRDQPLRERLLGQLMIALYRCGRQANALEAFQKARQKLVDELGVEPGDALRQLEHAILRQDPALASPRPRRPAARQAPDTPPAAIPTPASSRTPSGPGPSPRRVRKVVTALYCEVSEVVALADQLDPEVFTEVVQSLFADIRAIIKRHGGTLQNVMPNALLAVFGVPRVHEEDALRAVRAMAEVRDLVPEVGARLGVELRCRAGVSTGVGVVETSREPRGRPVTTGHSVGLAAALGQAARDGEVLLDADTLALVRDAVRAEPLSPPAILSDGQAVASFRLLGVDPLARGVARRPAAPLVGRSREMRLLRAAWEHATQAAACHLLTVLGSAGVGKSRLVRELLGEVGDAARVLRGRCLPYGEGITFWPLIEALHDVVAAVDPVLELLRRGGTATAEELFWETRRLLESLALERPTILHIDDLHWGEPMLLDLLDHVVDLSRGAPVLILCTARRELLDARPAWAGGKLNASTLLLEPLAVSDSQKLMERLGKGLEPDARRRIVEASEGNPLFLEEMAALARARGAVGIPPTIQALLAARLEQLPGDERDLLERGSIEGEVFHMRTLRALGDERAPYELQRQLSSLVRKELLRPHASMLEGDEAYRFRHVLIRDAAYEAVPKAIRGDLHERLANWIEGFGGELVERDELAGWHLEQAVRYRRELARPVPAELARRAAVCLYAAGLRARTRSDPRAARKHLEHALALAPSGDGLRCRISVALAEQLIETGDLSRADEIISAAERDPDSAQLAALSRLEWLSRVRPHEATRMFDARLHDIRAHLASIGDERALARTHLVARLPHVVSSRATLAATEAMQAAEHARRAADEGLRSRALGFYLTSLMYGQQSAQTIERELDAISRDASGPYLLARIELTRGELARLDGNFEEASNLTRAAIERFRALGMPEDEAACEQDLARVALWAGDAAAAVAALQRSDGILSELGERSRRSTTLAHLAEAHRLLDERDAAEAAMALSHELGGDEDVLNRVITHRVQAWLAVSDGDVAGARRWAASAVDAAWMTDYTVFQAAAMLDLARIESRTGQAGEAAAHAQIAAELFERKGDLTGMQRARSLLERLAAVA